MKWHYYIRFVFGMSSGEIKGILFLMLCISLFGLIQFFLPSPFPETAPPSLPHFWDQRLRELQQKNAKRATKKRSYFQPYYSSSRKTYDRSHFFKSTYVKKSSPWSAKLRIDINTADSLTWIELKGIGPGFAKRILTFREKLGGFHSLDQLHEVYGLDSLWILQNKSQLSLGQGIYRKFKINQLDWREFKHPYLSYAQAKLFLNYKKQHGPLLSFEELAKITLLDSKQWERLRPYLDFEIK